jgi:hypothetical protein
VFLGYLPDSLPLILKIPDKPLKYNEESLFHSQNDSFLCHDNPGMGSLINQINLMIQDMNESEELQKILQSLHEDHMAPNQ